MALVLSLLCKALPKAYHLTANWWLVASLQLLFRSREGQQALADFVHKFLCQTLLPDKEGAILYADHVGAFKTEYELAGPSAGMPIKGLVDVHPRPMGQHQ